MLGKVQRVDSTMWQPRLLNHSGTTVSVVIHLAVLLLVLAYAGVRPFNTVTAEPIAVDIVSPDEVKEAMKEAKTPQPLEIPELSTKEQPAPPPAPATPPQSQRQPAQQATPSAPANPKAEPRQAAAQPQPATASQAAAPPPQPASPWLPNLTGAAQPDISVRYQVNLGLSPLPNNDFDAPAMSTAKVESSDIAKFREQLKTCSILPAGVSPGDNVRIVIRAAFIPSGQLRAAPILIEASASAKGPLLMQAAIKALQECQPYAVLPADKYEEWKVLDLSFTPHDFNGG
jgi:hypothetical protein